MPWVKTVEKKPKRHICKKPKGWALSRMEYGSVWQCPRCLRTYMYIEQDYSQVENGLPLLATENYRWIQLDGPDVNNG